MRKYHQLLLGIVSVISVIFLIISRSENSRLKYVLEVVNIFGQTNDVDLVHLESDRQKYDFTQPTPYNWQRIGTGFYVYSSFWHKYPSMVGGEVITIAVGLQHAIVRFKCDVGYQNGTKQTGKFGFSREEEIAGIPPDTNSIENYIIYRFSCKILKDYVNHGQPQSILFTEISTNIKHRILIRNLNEKLDVPHKLEMATCLNLIELNLSSTSTSDSFILKFIYHHNLIGVDEIFIYDNGALSSNVKNQLKKHNIPITIFQFNFPFDIGHPLKIQRIIEIDCILRTMNLIKFVFIGTPNEYLIPDKNIHASDSFLKYFHIYEGDRFDIMLFNICLNANELIAKNLLHTNYENKKNQFISIYRPSLRLIDKDQNLKIVKTPQFELYAHRYDEHCDNKTEIYDWRSEISTKHLEFFDYLDTRVKSLLNN